MGTSKATACFIAMMFTVGAMVLSMTAGMAYAVTYSSIIPQDGEGAVAVSFEAASSSETLVSGQSVDLSELTASSNPTVSPEVPITPPDTDPDSRIIAKGKCGADGDNAEWTLNKAGVLIVSGTGKMQYCGEKTAPWYAFNESIKRVVVQKGITCIGKGAFEDCSQLESVSLPSSIDEIGGNAFCNCGKLQAFTVPGKLETIKFGTFLGCTSLQELDVPVGVKVIENDVFNNCDGLNKIYLPDTVESIGENAFVNVSASICVKKGSYADQFVQKEKLRFVYTCKYGHVWSKQYTTDVSPTCMRVGSQSIHCEVCDVVKAGSEREINKSEHVWNGGTVTTKPTYEEEGIKTFTCKYCSAIKTEKIAKLQRLSLANASIKKLPAMTYTGAVLTPNPTVRVGKALLEKGVDYALSYKDNMDAGTATVTVIGKGAYVGKKSITFNIDKAKQPMTVKAVNKKTKASAVKKKDVTFKNVIVVKRAQGKVTYKNVSVTKASKAIKINNSGSLTVPKGTKKGLYEVRVKVAAKGNMNYMSGNKTITVTVEVL